MDELSETVSNAYIELRLLINLRFINFKGLFQNWGRLFFTTQTKYD